jgi:hypothetical protein
LKRLALAALLCACSSARPRPAPELPGVLVHPSVVAANFLRTQKLLARFGSDSHSLEAVLQKQGDTLTLVALSPFRTRLFVLEQRGLEVKFTSYLPQELPFPPRYILYDVQRVYFRGLPGAPLADGEHSAAQDGETIRERWASGRLLERDFSRAGMQGRIAVTYQPGMAGNVSSPLIEIDNAWMGYHLTIQTISEQPLPP